MKQYACPYCKNTITKVPKKKGHCPHCNQIIWVKLAPGEHEKKLVTTAQAIHIDIAWYDMDISNSLNAPIGMPAMIKLEFPEPKRPLITLSGDEILRDIKKQERF